MTRVLRSLSSHPQTSIVPRHRSLTDAAPTKPFAAKRSVAALAVLTIAVLSPASASAQSAQSSPGPSAGNASPTQIREAEQRFEEGRALFSQRRLPEAHIKFEQACAVHRTVNCPKNLGLVEFELGHYVESTTHLREFLQTVRTLGPGAAGLDSTQVAQIQKKYNEAFLRSAHIEVTAPAGAKIIVEGRTIGTAPLPDTVDVTAGDHVIEAHTDHGILRKNVQVSAGQVAPVRFPNGDHAGSNAGNGAAPVRTEKPISSTGRTVTLVSLYGVAVAATGLGIGMLLHAEARSNEADGIRARFTDPSNACSGATSPDCDELRSLRDTYDNDRKIATIAFGGAAVFAVAATTAFFLWPLSSKEASKDASKEAPRTGARVVPLLAPGVGGLGYVGSF